MPYNGTGTFQPLAPPTYPAVAGETIMASRFNAVMSDLMAGLTNALTRDGQGAPTANLPMGGRKHTAVANATASDQYAAYGQLLNAENLATFLQSGTGAQARTFQKKLRNSLDVFDFLTDAEIADVQAYTYALDVTANVQKAVDEAWASGRPLWAPPGGYSLTGLTLVQDLNQRNRRLVIQGAGFGELFTIGLANPKGTIFKSTTNAPIFRVTTATVPASAGALTIQGILFDGSSTAAVVHLEAFYGICEFSYNQIFQRSTGSGLIIEFCATAEVHNNWVMNKDWVTSGLGAARVGIGIWLDQNYDAGLQTFRKNSVRGWNVGFKIGNGAASTYSYVAKIADSECSLCYNGIHLTVNARASIVEGNYLEGGDGGIGILNEGDYNRIIHNFTFPGFSTHIKCASFTYGDVVHGNILSAGALANQILIDITSSSVNGGPGKTCTANHLSFGGSGGSLAGVIGLRVNGTDPRINLSGTSTFPRGTWIGGAGTVKFSDLSADSDGSAGSGLRGLGMVADGAEEFPVLGRGVWRLGHSPAVLTQANVVANVLTITGAASFTMTATAATTVNSITGPNMAGKLFAIRTTNNNTTFANTASLKMAGGVNYTPGANGAVIWFRTQANVCEEQFRTAY